MVVVEFVSVLVGRYGVCGCTSKSLSERVAHFRDSKQERTCTSVELQPTECETGAYACVH